MKKQAANENTVPAVEKTVAILELLIRSEAGLTHAQLAERCGVTVSTCYRILKSLEKYNWIEKHSDGTFAPGQGLFSLSVKLCTNQTGNWEQTRQILSRLSAKTRLACKLSVRRGDDQVVTARAESPGPFSVSGKTGATFPVMEGSVGAALLADSSREELEELLKQCREPIPEKENPELLFSAVESVKRSGYILNTDNNRWRIGALSVPLRDPFGRIVGALTLLGMADDFSESHIPQYLKALKQAQDSFFK